MKKGMLLAALALAFLTGCGGQADAGGAEDADVALSSLYAGMEATCWRATTRDSPGSPRSSWLPWSPP